MLTAHAGFEAFTAQEAVLGSTTLQSVEDLKTPADSVDPVNRGDMTTPVPVKDSILPTSSDKVGAQLGSAEDLRPIIDVFLNPDLREERNKIMEETLGKLQEIFT